MAFRTVDEWQVERQFLPVIDSSFLPALPARWPHRKNLRKLSSGALALTLHGGFLYFLLSGLIYQPPTGEGGATGADNPEITMIELSAPVPDDPAIQENPDSNAQASAATTPLTEIELSRQTELPPEWSRSRMTVPRPVIAPAPSAIADASKANGEPSGGGVYDPYAGAAPNRRPEMAEAQKPAPKPTLAGRIAGYFGFGKDSQADADAFETWVASLRQRLPRAKGSVELTVTIGEDGRITASQIVGGSASPQVKFFVRNAVVGQRFSGVGDGEDSMRLPSIQLG
ncbi:protein TonB, links inner and outer membranes [Parasphingorhabdus marina DSM 22363]|uniref:Protein TonB, links inner and outer membranes n=1 Tax=Parasphingorhabdus marina DSM 22363 TaxID=1123272 RepID=A0A1N6HM61_9SPHN|nr:hypothetical protein [Parasphingorhabdus marina]SIO20769.1 protein TonB, links inner and outer membranes [Parasphingorhabdus marina DSM 22363]